MTRVAAIDCGTNSIRLLVAEIDPDTGALRDLDRRMEIVRLGQDVDRTGRAGARGAGAHLRGRRGLRRGAAATLGAERIRFVATSATRDAEQPAGVRRRRPASGSASSPRSSAAAEEAALSFAGATGDLIALGCARRRTSSSTSAAARPSSCAGRTRVEAARSVDIGCVRLTERHLHGDPPTAEEIRAACADIQAGLDAGRGRGVARGDRHARRRGRLGHDDRRARPDAGALRPRARSTASHLPVPDVVNGLRRPALDEPRLAKSVALHASRPGRRDRRRCADLARGRRPGAAAQRHPRGPGQRARHPRRHRAEPALRVPDPMADALRPHPVTGRAVRVAGAPGHGLAGRPGHAPYAGRAASPPTCSGWRPRRARGRARRAGLGLPGLPAAGRVARVGRPQRAAGRRSPTSPTGAGPGPGFGDPAPRLLIVGLAPAAQRHQPDRPDVHRRPQWRLDLRRAAPGRLRRRALEPARRRRPGAARRPDRGRRAVRAAGQQAHPGGAGHLRPLAGPRPRAGGADRAGRCWPSGRSAGTPRWPRSAGSAGCTNGRSRASATAPGPSSSCRIGCRPTVLRRPGPCSAATTSASRTPSPAS